MIHKAVEKWCISMEYRYWFDVYVCDFIPIRGNDPEIKVEYLPSVLMLWFLLAPQASYCYEPNLVYEKRMEKCMKPCVVVFPSS